MTDDATVSTDITGKKPAHDLAPTAPAETLGHAAGELDTVVQKPAQGLVHLEPVKRRKTVGERLFDITTYGGLALVGNEITATAIVNQADKPNLIGRAIRSCGAAFEKIGTPDKLPYLQKRINYINFAIIGGFVMVPLIKMLEDNKGRCVRFADRFFYGKRAEEPQIAEKHEEMDNAPKQTWGSLGKGRILTVAAAYTVDSTINWEHGLLARSLKGTRFENHASLEHLSNNAAKWVVDKLPSTKNLSPEKLVERTKFTKNLVGLTTLSATLTVLFYASSKLFAKKRDQKIERQYSDLTGTPTRDGEEVATTTAEPQTALAATAITTPNPAPAPTKPRSQVSNVELASTLAPAEQLAQGA